MKYSIEPLSSHLQLLHEISATIYNEWSHLIPGKSIADVEESLRLRTNSDKLPIAFVAVDINGDWVGTVSIKIHDLETRENLSPWLASLFVKENVRNLGIGKSLVGKVYETTREINLSEIYLYTDSKEQFYGNLGWTLIERQIYHLNEISIMKYSLT
jgi:N-acetylglutamate synthase-like GNAT family acetyltransferase